MADFLKAGQGFGKAVLIKGINLINIALRKRKATGILRLYNQHPALALQLIACPISTISVVSTTAITPAASTVILARNPFFFCISLLYLIYSLLSHSWQPSSFASRKALPVSRKQCSLLDTHTCPVNNLLL